ncbi:Uncharacterised protein [Enterobacter hormaechei]|nr:Uncharacterised protein [Enterobacter hormaechei]VAM29935.1 Uncharacterised protein [Enterobacter hormaechei]
MLQRHVKVLLRPDWWQIAGSSPVHSLKCRPGLRNLAFWIPSVSGWKNGAKVAIIMPAR